MAEPGLEPSAVPKALALTLVFHLHHNATGGQRAALAGRVNETVGLKGLARNCEHLARCAAGS